MNIDKKIITELIRKDARKEANEILSMATEAEKEEFMSYWNKKSGNVCCLVIDTIKTRLVKEGKMKQYFEDNFGHPLI